MVVLIPTKLCFHLLSFITNVINVIEEQRDFFPVSCSITESNSHTEVAVESTVAGMQEGDRIEVYTCES